MMVDEDYPDGIGYKHGESVDDGISVRFQGCICRPRFNGEGPARAYLSALQSGTRKAEFEEAPV